MPRFAQVDAGVVTGLLTGPSMPAKLPPGRVFVAVEDEADVRELDTYDGAAFERPKNGAAKPPVVTLEDVLTAVTAIKVKVGA